jgi:pimeloyl-ACP methyl ester carboxylesterase
LNLAAPLSDKANALECAAACGAVYDVCSLQTEDCHLFVKEFETFVRVDVRGSKSSRDWINDLDFDFVDTIYGKVHHGFWRSSAPMFPQLKAQLKPILKPIVLDGHSLGGAQATLFALDLAIEKFPVALITSFGSPRVADGEFKTLYDRLLGSKTIRYVNALDVVPRTPFSDLGFIHVGQEGYLPSTGALELNPTFYELIHDDVINMVSNIRAGNIGMLTDHLIASYQTRIQNL